MKYLETARKLSGIEAYNNNEKKKLELIDSLDTSRGPLGYINSNGNGYEFEPEGIPLSKDNLEALYVFFRELNKES